MISKTTTIEDLVTILPESVNYFMEKGIRLLICGEPVWGTISEIVLSKGYNDDELNRIIDELNEMHKTKTNFTEQ